MATSKILLKSILQNNKILISRNFSSSTCRCASYKSEPWEEIYTAHEIDPTEPTFGKILIANRGEIACRVIRTCRKMGIKTVAVHSVADSMGLFVKMADEAINIGPAPARESYLVMEKILDAVKQTGAEAVHPGYGFLSENTLFVAELEKAGVKFIGPNSKAISEMGDKLASKRLATQAGVNGIPGYDGVIEDADHCVALSKDIGYPVMVKASAGGGGKGMRIAWNDDEAALAFRLCSEEARSSFGDDRMIVEKFVDSPRHIEIQMLGDKHGNAIHLNERECSIQRRNQKVIEEAPSPFLDPATRAAMGEQAIQLSKAIVHQMIRSAYGHPLHLKQEDIGIRGWAFESRVYAEDPFKNFGMPSIGRLHKYEEPRNIPGVRCDSGIEEGSEISMFYDPMICKLTCYGATREDAIATSVNALDHYVIRGVTHNIPLLRDVLTEDVFNSGVFTTSYLPQTYPDGFKGINLNEKEKLEVASLAAICYAKESLRANNRLTDTMVRNYRPLTSWELEVMVKGESIPLTLHKGDSSYRVSFATSSMEVVDNFNLADSVFDTFINGENIVVQLKEKKSNGALKLRYKGTALDLEVIPASAARLKHYMPVKAVLDTSRVILSPMPGVVRNLSVQVGDKVGEGQECAVVEAMKMQNSLTSGVAGVVKAVHVKVGDTVEDEQIMIEIE
ncbi:propionyl-CoA carboxylase alpha chain, mitochondrial [Eurytemora carolleeae]|uniref:propionyl-CoA carboxylase alpha chain, mitochondrial n=1 Tax=Eurytemora carolleeae TaxID=1294199 RepID=UPI000C787239|nr:propionyl-CoA carboxylase alpha chain, mitochondrial [Eurytemora carolleeae]|eukprot:XP_023347250.1 propionyl-CoA carboxylase alpha chain, mitochondrial-like [Eurytemora affinis]